MWILVKSRVLAKMHTLYEKVWFPPQIALFRKITSKIPIISLLLCRVFTRGPPGPVFDQKVCISIVFSWYFHDIRLTFWKSYNFEIKFQFQVKQKFWDTGKYMFRALCEQHSKRISEIRSILCTMLSSLSSGIYRHSRRISWYLHDIFMIFRLNVQNPIILK